MYKCSVCSLGVIVLPNSVIKACNCKDSVIIAEISSDLKVKADINK